MPTNPYLQVLLAAAATVLLIVLFSVALLYGVLVLVALPFDLLVYGKDTILWGYVAVDALFLLPIGLIFLWQEYARWKQRRGK